MIRRSLMKFQNTLPALDVEKEIDLTVEFIRDQAINRFRRDGIVVGISGGIDSAVTAILSQKAVGNDKLITIIMPEKESNPISAELAEELAAKFGMKTIYREITPVLEAYGAYKMRDDIVRKYFPEFDGSQKWKLVQPGSLLEKDSLNVYSIKMESESGPAMKRITGRDLRAIVGATNLKHRTRMSVLYHVAESENYLVAGTTNLSETLLGFYVKYGDGGVDIEPLSHLYKTYIYQLGRHLGVPEGIINRSPSPDTFSSETSDDEFFFRLPYDTLDVFMWAMRENVPADIIAETMGIEPKKVNRIFGDLKRKEDSSYHFREMPAGPNRRVP